MPRCKTILLLQFAPFIFIFVSYTGGGVSVAPDWSGGVSVVAVLLFGDSILVGAGVGVLVELPGFKGVGGVVDFIIEGFGVCTAATSVGCKVGGKVGEGVAGIDGDPVVGNEITAGAPVTGIGAGVEITAGAPVTGIGAGVEITAGAPVTG
eukprot:CAMPEP_0118685182 /NCGR_PEP_ID=MMETSP0800-20121206/7092_1 /TAXON_ID=210618 ORGANISM="Striatella unipunctata, Strain CCMP2910" /NCGR_SAMPLE_ID=MMETSP0800 /ASSEMBLY_ACC=CAM_ASM_000638 /LENGTH=150 /DNA_ID=CAMNT_0006582041 /DNA_START=515 /DNA_END=963 /DNA_ORIENTATION=+